MDNIFQKILDKIIKIVKVVNVKFELFLNISLTIDFMEKSLYMMECKFFFAI